MRTVTVLAYLANYRSHGRLLDSRFRSRKGTLKHARGYRLLRHNTQPGSFGKIRNGRDGRGPEHVDEDENEPIVAVKAVRRL